MERERVGSPSDKLVLRKTYGVMGRLQAEGRNHIWGYVARNLARPIWLASEAQKADIVIGNTPWVSYRYMSGAFKNRFRSEFQATELWVGGKVAIQQDLAGYFHLREAALCTCVDRGGLPWSCRTPRCRAKPGLCSARAS